MTDDSPDYVTQHNPRPTQKIFILLCITGTFFRVPPIIIYKKKCNQEIQLTVRFPRSPILGVLCRPSVPFYELFPPFHSSTPPDLLFITCLRLKEMVCTLVLDRMTLSRPIHPILRAASTYVFSRPAVGERHIPLSTRFLLVSSLPFWCLLGVLYNPRPDSFL